MINRWTFDNDELFELVRIGQKRGTCSRNSDEEPMAKIGDIQETDWLELNEFVVI